MKKLALPRRNRPAKGEATPAKSEAPVTRPLRAKLPRPWKLFRAALAQFRAGFRSYLKIIAVVAVPASLIGILVNDTVSGTYISFASIIMNVAFLWAAARHHETGRVPSLSGAYYDGSIALVRFILAVVMLVIFLIPLAIGLFLLSIGLTSAYGDITLSEQLLVGAIALVISLPGIFLGIRFGQAPIATVASGLRPVAALGMAWRLSSGRFWALLLRYIGLLVVIFIWALPVSLLSIGLILLKANGLAGALFEILLTLWVLPIINIFLLKLYYALDGPAAAIPASTAAPEPEAAP